MTGRQECCGKKFGGSNLTSEDPSGYLAFQQSDIRRMRGQRYPLEKTVSRVCSRGAGFFDRNDDGPSRALNLLQCFELGCTHFEHRLVNDAVAPVDRFRLV